MLPRKDDVSRASFFWFVFLEGQKMNKEITILTEPRTSGLAQRIQFYKMN